MLINFPFYTRGYSEAFCHAVHFVLNKEGGLRADGGYVNDPNDAGGETKYGISKRAYPNLNISALTIDSAVRLYHRDYWKAAHCHEWPGGIGLVVFDTAVQHGYIKAIQLLQEITGCKVDGRVGPKTRAAVHACDPEWLIARLSLRRARFYARIVKNNHTQVRFIEGWHNRLAHLVDEAWQHVASLSEVRAA